MNRLHASLAVALLATAACGDDEPGVKVTPLTCAWLADENNCWRQVALAAESCAATAPGILADDGKSCAFDDGFEVKFDPALPLPIDMEFDPTLKFTATRDGATCLQVDESDTSWEVTTSAGTVRMDSTEGSMDATITCADGSLVRGDVMKLFSCDDGGLFSFPGPGLISNTGEFTVFLNGAKRTDPQAGSLFSFLPVFSCEEPQDPQLD